jgi:multiple sugar transport system permease protein
MALAAGWTVCPFAWFFLVSLTVPGRIPRRFEIPDVMTAAGYREILAGTQSILPNAANSILVAGLAVVICLSLTVGAAYVFSRFSSWPLRALLSSLLVVRMTPGVSLVVPVFLLMLRYRLVDTHVGLALVYVLLSMPLAVWLMKGFFDTIPRELEEQAYVDGATLLGALRAVVLPAAAPGLAVTASFIFLGAYIEFLFALVLSRGRVVTVPLAIAGFVSEHQTFYNEMAAAAFVSMLPLAIAFYVFGRHMVAGLTLGALK